MIDRILVPLDGSARAERVLGHLLTLAPVFESEARLLRVVRPGRVGGLSRDPVEWRLDRGDAGRYLQGLADRLARWGMEAEVEVREGRAAEEIVLAAREGRADLVLLSAVGHGANPAFPLGGTVQKVLSRLPTSVLLVHPGKGGAVPLHPVAYRRVLLLSDCSRRGERAARVAACVARAQDVELELVHVVRVPELPDPLLSDAQARRLRDSFVERSRRGARSYLEEVRRTACGEGVDVRLRIVASPDVASELHRICRENEDGLTMTCSHAGSRTGPGLQGGVVTGLLQHAPGSLLVLQDPAVGETVPDGGREREPAVSGREPSVRPGARLHYPEPPW